VEFESLRLLRRIVGHNPLTWLSEPLVPIVALQNYPRPACRHSIFRIALRQPRLHLRRPVETPLQLRQLLRIKIRAIVLLPHSVVIIDEYFHGIRT
jgi:hypothetical protein